MKRKLVLMLMAGVPSIISMPKGLEIEVHDYDVRPDEEGLQRDGDGELFLSYDLVDVEKCFDSPKK